MSDNEAGDGLGTVRALAKLEGKLDGLDSKLEHLGAGVTELRKSLDRMPRDFMSRAELEARFRAVEERVSRIEKIGGAVIMVVLLGFVTGLWDKLVGG